MIRAIDERGLAIRNIAGCSMGALIGGIYASGELDTYTDWANRLEKRDVVRLLGSLRRWGPVAVHLNGAEHPLRYLALFALLAANSTYLASLTFLSWLKGWILFSTAVNCVFATGQEWASSR